MKKITLILFIHFCVLSNITAQVVTTFAGSEQGSVNGTGTAAQFNRPYSICRSPSGDFYVADYVNNQIRKITPQGVVTTLAGTTQEGYANGPGATAQFWNPWGICVDAAGNIYVADSENYKIRKITPAGIVSTFAGSSQGFANGAGTAAKFGWPTGICVDFSGNIYVVDTANTKIRKITPAGVVTTFAGSTQGSTNGTGASAKFYEPYGICSDSAGNLYVADVGTNTIRKITPGAVVSTFAGSGEQGILDGIGTAAQFRQPFGVCTDTANNIYVADTTNDRIRKITPARVVTTLAGSDGQGYLDGPAAVSQFFLPIGVCSDPSGNIYVADNYNDRIRKIIPASLGANTNEVSNNQLTIYPNPVHAILNIKVDLFFEKAKILLTDVTGKIISSQELLSSETDLSINGYPKGTYFVTIIDGIKKLTQKVIIE